MNDNHYIALDFRILTPNVTRDTEERVREDNEEKTQCTFQPKLFTKRFNETSGINPKLV